MKTATFDQNQVIFEQGSASDCMYDIVSGKVGLYVNYQQENENQLAVLKTGEIFGEMGLVESLPRSATAVALEAGTVLSPVAKEDLEGYLKYRPDQVLKLLRALSQRTRETDRKYHRVCQVIYENEQAEKRGDGPNPDINRQLEDISREYGSVNTLWLH